MLTTVNLAKKFQSFSEQWSPKIVGEVNDAHVKLTKLQGDFVWHHHPNEDEMFLVVKGWFTMKLRDGDQKISEGEFIIIPHGVEHCPSAPEECHILLVEPKTTLNTGNLRNERTKENLEKI